MLSCLVLPAWKLYNASHYYSVKKFILIKGNFKWARDKSETFGIVKPFVQSSPRNAIGIDALAFKQTPKNIEPRTIKAL